MTKTALLHIGTPKTGTSSIQDCLARARVDGSLGRICYPLWADDLYQLRLAALYVPEETWTRRFYPMRRREIERYRRFLFGKLRASNSAILSAEVMSWFFPPPAVARLRADLESVGFRNFHVVLYIRDPADFYLSVTQQHLREPVHSAAPFVEDPATFAYGFRRIAETWEQVFPGRLIVRRFPTDPRHDVVDDFAAVLHQCLGVGLHRVPTRSNATLSAEGMQILQDYRETYWPDEEDFWTPDVARLVTYLQQSVQDIGQTRPVLKRDIADRIRASHQTDADELASRYGVDLGLRTSDPVAVAPRRKPYRVSEIVESVDPAIVQQILLRLTKTELERLPAKPPLPWRVATRAYRTIPTAYRPVRLLASLRAMANRRKAPG